MIPYGRQEITQDDIDAVVETLKSDFLTSGPAIEKFEKRVAEYCGVKYAVAVASCTAALHIAYLSLGLGKGKRLWTSPNTFVATANAALYCGADVDFVDIDPETFNLSVSALEAKLVEAEKNGTLPDIVTPVHFSGQSCDLKQIKSLADKYGFDVVEDGAHCIGASYDGQKVGSCTYSKACVFSFHPVKIITTGEGGLVTTNDEEVYQALLRLRTHGITRGPALLHDKDQGSWYFEQVDLGYHYRITDLQCALGTSQMDRLDDYVGRRQELAERYTQKLKHLPLQLPTVLDDCESSWHLYVVLIDGDAAKRREIYDKMRDAGIGVNVHYIPVYAHPYYQELGFDSAGCPNNEAYYRRAITLPLFPGLTEEEQDYICETLEKLVQP